MTSKPTSNESPPPRDPAQVSKFFDKQAEAWESAYSGASGYAKRFFVSRMNKVLEFAGLELAIHRAGNSMRGQQDGGGLLRLSPLDLEKQLGMAGFIPTVRGFTNFLPYNLAMRLPGSPGVDAALARLAKPTTLGRRMGATYILRAERPA